MFRFRLLAVCLYVATMIHFEHSGAITLSESDSAKLARHVLAADVETGGRFDD